MKPHSCTLSFQDKGRNVIAFGKGQCQICLENKKALCGATSPQLSMKFPKVAPPKLRALMARERTPLDQSLDSAVVVPATELDLSRQNKLQNVLNELHVSELHVAEPLKHSLIAVIDRCLDAFAENDDDVGFTNLVEHRIDSGDAKPIRQKLRPLAFHRRSFVDKEIERYLKLDIICPADAGKCPWASPIVVVTKKEEDATKMLDALRMCIDFRKVNSVTEKDSYPLPNIDSLFVELHKAKCFASLDLLMGYHQISIHESDRPKTAFITHKGLFMFKRMPFGLCNAPATFQRLMDALFSGLVGKVVLVYLDDLLIFAETEEELLLAIEKILQILKNAKLKCKPRKCKLFRSKIHYLGHEISKDGIAPDPAKVEKVRAWPFPKTGNDMLSFLGVCNYYRRLISHFAEHSASLYAVAQLPEIAETENLKNDFEKLKESICALTFLKLPNPSEPFILETDASNVALGAVLKQSNGEVETPVSFFSKGLTKPERNYSTYERELLAVVKSCEFFNIFLLGAPFILRTDHRALTAIFTSKLSHSSRFVNWIIRLQEFSLKIEYRAGDQNVIADALSRIPWPMSSIETPLSLHRLVIQLHLPILRMI